MSYDYKFKIIVIGSKNVGKTAITTSFVSGRFRTYQPSTVGVEFMSRQITLGDKTIQVNIWDTTGDESYAEIFACYYKDCAGVILVFDVTDKMSFDKLNFWIEQMEKVNPDREVPFIVVGNKIDKHFNRVIFARQGERFSRRHNAPYIETSAKDDINIELVFSTLIEKVMSQYIVVPDKTIGIMSSSKDEYVPLQLDDKKVNSCQEVDTCDWCGLL